MTEIPSDIFQTACGIVMEAKSLKSMLKHKDVADAIAVAILAERERCASLAEWFSNASVNAEWTEDARGSAYYACADVAEAIRNPKPQPEPSKQVASDDDLPF